MGRDRTLDDQLAEVKELLAEARGITKDLNHAVDRARDAFKGLAEEHMGAVIAEERARMSAELAREIEQTKEQIIRSFWKMATRLMTGKPNGNNSRGGVNLGELLKEVLAEEDEPQR